MPIGSRRRSRVRAPRALAILAVLVPLAAASASPAATPPSGTVTPTAPFIWQGPVATGQNQAYDPGTGEPCGQTVADFCDTALVNVVPGDFFATNGGDRISHIVLDPVGTLPPQMVRVPAGQANAGNRAG